MKNLVKKLTIPQLDSSRELGFLVLRAGIGALFLYIGLTKIMAGPDVWEKVGSALSIFGINFAPTFFGLVAAITEFAGGILLFLGGFTRLAAFFLAGTMVVATVLKFTTVGFPDAGYPLTMLIIMVSYMIAGAGPYSIDAILKKK
ncbi:MAG: DoxX family protein [Sumerlaeia bacterium]